MYLKKRNSRQNRGLLKLFIKIMIAYNQTLEYLRCIPQILKPSNFCDCFSANNCGNVEMSVKYNVGL